LQVDKRQYKRESAGKQLHDVNGVLAAIMPFHITDLVKNI